MANLQGSSDRAEPQRGIKRLGFDPGWTTSVEEMKVQHDYQCRQSRKGLAQSKNLACRQSQTRREYARLTWIVPRLPTYERLSCPTVSRWLYLVGLEASCTPTIHAKLYAYVQRQSFVKASRTRLRVVDREREARGEGGGFFSSGSGAYSDDKLVSASKAFQKSKGKKSRNCAGTHLVSR